MKVYEMSEFIFMLRCGMWCGGSISGFGYISAARKTESVNVLAGLRGVRLSNSIMLERSVPRSFGETEMLFSVYDPYTGGYTFSEATANFKGDAGTALLSGITTPHRQGLLKRLKLRRRKGIYVTTYKLSALGMEPVTRRLR